MHRTLHLARLCEHDAWANRTAIGSIRAAAHPPDRALALMAHIVGAEWLWWARLHQEAARFAVWPTLSLDQMETESSEAGRRWRTYISGFSDGSELTREVPYTNSQGESFTSAVEDVLLHVVQHSAYHRGQIAMVLRDSGNEPALTDFIHARRQGFIG
jgi:uncharacterized damage-inducible protein DinB